MARLLDIRGAKGRREQVRPSRLAPLRLCTRLPHQAASFGVEHPVALPAGGARFCRHGQALARHRTETGAGARGGAECGPTHICRWGSCLAALILESRLVSCSDPETWSFKDLILILTGLEPRSRSSAAALHASARAGAGGLCCRRAQKD